MDAPLESTRRPQACAMAVLPCGNTRGELCHSIGSSTTGLLSEPIFSMVTVTTSPGLSQRGGLWAKPTPCGVPVRITVPGKSVVLPLRNSISLDTSKIMSSVFQSCNTSPPMSNLIASALGLGISSAVTRHGPNGAKVSNVLPRHHWPPRRASRRALGVHGRWQRRRSPGLSKVVLTSGQNCRQAYMNPPGSPAPCSANIPKWQGMALRGRAC